MVGVAEKINFLAFTTCLTKPLLWRRRNLLRHRLFYSHILSLYERREFLGSLLLELGNQLEWRIMMTGDKWTDDIQLRGNSSLRYYEGAARDDTVKVFFAKYIAIHFEVRYYPC